MNLAGFCRNCLSRWYQESSVELGEDITTDEAKLIESTLGVPVMVGTVSFGSPFIGAGCAASDTHAMVGTGSTGPEMNRIEDALGLI